MKKLGIVFPTYNRCNYAYEGVSALIPQLLRNQEHVSLLITDNASPDSTEEMLKPFAEKYSNFIVYVRQKQNIGPHANFYYGIENIQAEYIYLLGDDDIVSPHLVDILLNLLSSNQEIGMLHFNFLSGVEDLHSVKACHESIRSKSLCLKYSSGWDFVKDFLIAPSFMSSNVFRKDCMLKGMENNYHEDCFGYDWLLCLYSGIVDKECLYYDLPLVVQRFGRVYQNFALNTIVGQHKLFEYLSNKTNDLVSLWEDEVKYQKCYNAIAVISTIPEYRDFYKSKYKDLENCLKSKIQRMCLFVSVYFIPEVSLPILFLVRIVNKIYLLVRNVKKR